MGDKRKKRRDIVEMRKALGLSRDQLAIVMRASANTVGRWERGDAAPSVDAERQIQQLILMSKDSKGLDVLKSVLQVGGPGALCGTISAVGATLSASFSVATTSFLTGAISPTLLFIPAAYGLYKALDFVFGKEKNDLGHEACDDHEKLMELLKTCDSKE